jgi:hypothetical protein
MQLSVVAQSDGIVLWNDDPLQFNLYSVNCGFLTLLSRWLPTYEIGELS